MTENNKAPESVKIDSLTIDGWKWIKESTSKDQTRQSLRECINLAKAHLSEQFGRDHDVVINDVLENVLATMEEEI